MNLGMEVCWAWHTKRIIFLLFVESIVNNRSALSSTSPLTTIFPIVTFTYLIHHHPLATSLLETYLLLFYSPQSPLILYTILLFPSPHFINTRIAVTSSSIQHLYHLSHLNGTLLKMRKHPDSTCHQDPNLDGVCGCTSFWQHTSAALPPANIATESGTVNACALPIRKRQRDANLNASSMQGSAAKRLRLDKCGEEVKVQSGTLGGENVGARTNEQMSGKKKKKKRKKRKSQLKREAEAKQGERAVKILVDYDLPTGDERLNWDTDKVRRMAREIE